MFKFNNQYHTQFTMETIEQSQVEKDAREVLTRIREIADERIKNRDMEGVRSVIKHMGKDRLFKYIDVLKLIMYNCNKADILFMHDEVRPKLYYWEFDEIIKSINSNFKLYPFGRIYDQIDYFRPGQIKVSTNMLVCLEYDHRINTVCKGIFLDVNDCKMTQIRHVAIIMRYKLKCGRHIYGSFPNFYHKILPFRELYIECKIRLQQVKEEITK